MSPLRILISPLNWGFGHAGRMTAFAKRLQERGHEVIFAADKAIVDSIAEELPGVRVISITGITMRYSRIIPAYLAILLRLPLLAAASVREYFTLKRLAGKLHPDIIISDNRFGFFHRSIYSVYVTHMLRIPFPSPLRFLEPAGVMIHRMIIRQYDLCLVPDFPMPPDIAGRLSHLPVLPERTIYTGPLSRFEGNSDSLPSISLPQSYICLIVSGPEPQSTLFIKKVITAAGENHLIILTRKPVSDTLTTSSKVRVICKAGTSLMRHVIQKSRLVICRSGYSTVMELISLKKGAVLVPTPGQTEQEYLARHLDKRYGFVFVRQKDLTGSHPLPEITQINDAAVFPDSNLLLNYALDALTEKDK